MDALDEVNEVKQSYDTEHQERVKAEGEVKEVGVWRGRSKR